MQLPLSPRRYTLHITQHSQQCEPTWQMRLLRPDDTLVSAVKMTCTHAKLADGLAALAFALPGLTVVYDEPSGVAA